MNQNAADRTAKRTDLVNVVLTGSECTGKTTLARRLADHFEVEMVPEFVRTLAETVGGRLNFADHGPIARGQMALADERIAHAKDLLIHDTDLVSTVLYCRHYFGRCPEWIEAAAIDRKADLYLVCDIDVPWVADKMRDGGDRREEMHAMFIAQLETIGANWKLVRGDGDARFAMARDLVESVRL